MCITKEVLGEGRKRMRNSAVNYAVSNIPTNCPKAKNHMDPSPSLDSLKGTMLRSISLYSYKTKTVDEYVNMFSFMKSNVRCAHVLSV
jgi:hypothetical protein